VASGRKRPIRFKVKIFRIFEFSVIWLSVYLRFWIEGECQDYLLDAILKPSQPLRCVALARSLVARSLFQLLLLFLSPSLDP